MAARGGSGHASRASPISKKRGLVKSTARILLLAGAGLLVFAAPPSSRAIAAAAPQTAASSTTDVLWDRWGVPHIFAPNLNESLYAFGWAQMESHGDLLLRLYGQARGRGAEYWGVNYADTDRWVRTMGVPARATKWAAAQAPDVRGPLMAFVAGLNAYARAHADRLSAEVQVVLPVNLDDVVAHLQRVVLFAFVANPQSLDAQMKRWAD